MIPSSKKQYNECLAKKILQLYNPCKYSNLKCADMPDLFDEASSLGVEVTSDFPDEEWKRLIHEAKRINRQGDSNTAHDYITIKGFVPFSTINTENEIDKKLCKTYDGVTNLELFIFIADIKICKEYIPGLINYWLGKQEHSPTKYERLFLYSAAAEILWECERHTKKVAEKQLPDHFSQDILRSFDP